MALLVTTGSIPKDAVVLSATQAVTYQWNQIMQWPHSMDVWPFKYGIGFMGLVAAATGAFINKHYRVKLKLRQYGYGSTIIPMTLAPAMFSTILHSQIITTDIFLRRTKCPLCLQYRAYGIQLGCAIAYPAILSPVANFMFAVRHGTYRVPYWKDHKGHIDLWLKLTRPLGRNLFLLAIVQVLAAGFITHAEGECFYKIQLKLLDNQEGHFIEGISSAKN